MTLTDLEALADAAMNCAYPNAPWMTAVIDYRDAANPQTIKQLIALCKLQNEVIKALLNTHDYSAADGEKANDYAYKALSAFDAFQEEK